MATANASALSQVHTSPQPVLACNAACQPASASLIRLVAGCAQHTFDDCIWRGQRFTCEYTNTSDPVRVEGAPWGVRAHARSCRAVHLPTLAPPNADAVPRTRVLDSAKTTARCVRRGAIPGAILLQHCRSGADTSAGGTACAQLRTPCSTTRPTCAPWRRARSGRRGGGRGSPWLCIPWSRFARCPCCCITLCCGQ